MAEITSIDFELDPATVHGGLGEDFKSEPRSPGIHLSGVIRDLEKARGQKRQIYEEQSPDDRNKALRYWEMGFTWEIVMETVFKRRMIQSIPDSDNFIRQ